MNRFKIFSICAIMLLMLSFPASAIPVTEYITESGYWTCPTNVFVAQITVTAAGGGGMGGNATHVGYSGHNGTTVYLTDYPVTPGIRYPITIGKGGRATPGYSTQPIFAGPAVSYSATPHYYETSNGEQVYNSAFGVQGIAGTGASLMMETSSKGYSVNGWAGYGSYVQTQRGGDGFGSLTFSYGGNPGVGFGAGGPGGGMGGVGGTGGNGIPGANGGVTITYDIDASQVMLSGTVSDAISGAAIPSASLTFGQNNANHTVASDGSGVFNVPSSTGLLTGYAITETISATGYYTETFTIVPYVSEVVPQTVSLIPTTFDRSANGTISGIFRDQYGSSISTVGLTLTNSTGGILSTTSTAKGFYYFNNVPRMTTWNAVATKTGYANASTTFVMGYY